MLHLQNVEMKKLMVGDKSYMIKNHQILALERHNDNTISNKQ